MIRRRLPGGDLWKYYLGFAIARIGTIVVLPIVAHLVGPERYGGFEAMVSVMLGAMIVGDAGLGTAMVRFVGDPGHDRVVLIRAAAKAQLIASLVAAAIAAVPMLLLAPSDVDPIVVLLALLAFTLVEGFSALGAGLLRADARNGRYLGLACLRLVTAASIGGIGAAQAGVAGGLFGVALAGLGFAVVAVVAALRSGSAPTGSVADGRRVMLRYGLPLMLTSLMTWTLSLSDRVFLLALSGPIELAQYAASYRVGSLIMLFVTAPLALAWLPVARAAAHRVQRQRVTVRWSLGLAWCALGGGALIVMACPVLVPVLFGSGFESRPGIAAAVVVSAWFSGLYILVATEVLTSDATRPLAPVMVSVVSLNLVLNLAMISAWDATGAGLATVASYALLVVGVGLAVSRESLQWMAEPRHLTVVAALLASVVAAWLAPAMAILLLAVAALAGRRGGPAGRPAER